jgi:oxysterol-binding protein-related protein 9/10/11
VFVAPAGESDPARRALLVLKWFLSSLRNQQYAGRDPKEGVKKPLNAFLGEVFLAKWEDDAGVTQLVSEQVSHHPPVTACRVWNDKNGVYAEGFTRQEITFSGTVNIQQIGRATLRLSKHNDETYLIPLPNVKVSGILTGNPYPELGGIYYIPSTSGYISKIEFSGKSFFRSSSKKHSFQASLYKEDLETKPLYTVSGNWDSTFTIHDANTDTDIETFNAATAASTPLSTASLTDQDPWESRLAWKSVREALDRGDMQRTSDAKNELENGQRAMRKAAGDDGESWPRAFFRDAGEDLVAKELAGKVGGTIVKEDTKGIWIFRVQEWEKGIERPFHGDLRPDNSQTRGQNGKSRSASHVTATSGKSISGDADISKRERSEASSQTAAAVIDRDITVNEDRVEQPSTEGIIRSERNQVNGLTGRMGDMSMQEKIAVEEMLRDRHASMP